MNKKKLIISALVMLFSFFVFSITISYLIINYKDNGKFEINKQYYNAIFSNVSFKYKTSMSVKLNNDYNRISVKIPDLNEFKNNKKFSIDVTNIGNIDIYVKDLYITDIFSNIDTKNVKINVLLNKNDILKGGETKKIDVTINYNGKEKIESPYYEFNINYIFDEVIL